MGESNKEQKAAADLTRASRRAAFANAYFGS
jgi:hypothetical protein